jgi:DNA-binding ferritin-like protein
MKMDFFDKLGETISTKGKEVTGKAKDLAEVANLKGQISTCEDVIKKNYTEIGKKYYEMHAAAPEEEYDEQCRAIANAQNAIVDLENKIKEIKGI